MVTTVEPKFIDLPTGVRLHYRDWGGPSARLRTGPSARLRTGPPASLRTGSGAPLVLLHGLASGCRIWDMMAPHLVETFRVVAPDQRGHGLSDKPGSYSFAEVTADLAAFMKTLGLWPAVIAGHSWGGSVALQFAVDHPGAVRALVLIDGGFLETSAWLTWEQAEKVMRPPAIDGMPLEAFLKGARSWPDLRDLWSPQLEEMFLSNFEVRDGKVYRRLPVEQHMMIVRAIWEQRPSQLWEHVRCPVLMLPAVREEGDPQRAQWTRAKLEAIELARGKLQHSRLVEMRDSIHDVPVQRPRELAEVITEFAAEIA